jgi:hypothetical protein
MPPVAASTASSGARSFGSPGRERLGRDQRRPHGTGAVAERLDGYERGADAHAATFGPICTALTAAGSQPDPVAGSVVQGPSVCIA